MPDDPRHFDPDNPENDSPVPGAERGESDVPASVEFMEMMRQAAARSRPKNIWTDPDVPSRNAPAGSSRSLSYRDRRRTGESDAVPNEQSGESPNSPVTSSAPTVKETDHGGESVPLTTAVPEIPTASAPPAPVTPVEAAPQPQGETALTEEALEEQRIRRVKRRQTRRRRRTVGVLGGIVRSTIVVTVAAAIMATIFTWWTPSGFIRDDVRQELSVAMATSAVTQMPTGLPTPNWLRRIGIVSGHRGPEGDPGAVCPDGLTEAEINFNVAQLVVRNLRGRGYTVDLLDEFDPRLDNYQAAALVSIHSNTCQDFGEVVSGYLIAAAAARVTARGNDEVLVGCIAQHYQVASGLQRREGVTVDMTDYHSFREIHAQTPAAIIELGFMLADSDVLTGQPDSLARGITDGILCYLEPGAAPTLPPPTAEA